MLFRLSKCKVVRLSYCAAILAVEPGYIYNQFDLAATDGKHLEDPRFVTESDDSARFAVRALQIVLMNISIEDRLVQKSTFLYCTPDTPKV